MPPAAEIAPDPSGAAASAASGVPSAGSETVAELFDALKRQEEMLRDMIIEIRLLYHNLSEKEKQKLESRREAITRDLREGFAPAIHALEERAARLRGK